MKKFTIYNLQFTIKLVLFIFTFYILHFTFYIPSALALETTPSADIRAKLEELKKEIASKAALLKGEINRRLKDKAYVGKVKTKSENTITLATRSGPKIININQDSEFESKIKTKKKFSAKTITEEDFVAALGDVDETGVLTAKKIILLPTTNNQQPKTYLWGQIVAISDKLITLKDKNLKNLAVSIPDQSGLKLNNFTILTGNFGKNEIFEAQFVYVKKVTTPSAQTATPSAKKR